MKNFIKGLILFGVGLILGYIGEWYHIPLCLIFFSLGNLVEYLINKRGKK